jgi:hypothetical protein
MALWLSHGFSSFVTEFAHRIPDDLRALAELLMLLLGERGPEFGRDTAISQHSRYG